MQSCSLRRAPPPLTCYDLIAVAVRPKENRLEHTALCDRVCEFLDRLFVEHNPRLVRVRTDAADLDLTDAVQLLSRALFRR
jgi:hypothetical protein